MDGLLYRTHVGRFDTTCAGNSRPEETSDNERHTDPLTHSSARREAKQKWKRSEDGI